MTADPAPLTARRHGPLAGRARVPGDKSISIRALILGALAVGETRIGGLLEGEDVINTAQTLRALGAHVERTGERQWLLRGVGVGGFAEPAAALDFGNSGTGCRLDARRGRRLPGDGDVRRRCVAAQAADAPRARSLGTHRRAHARLDRRPAAADARRRARSDPDRVPAAGAVGAAEVGGAARRPCRAGRNRRDRSRGDARSYREDADPFRRASAGRAGRGQRPPHHADRPAGTRAAADRGSRRSVLGGIPDDRRPDHAAAPT